MHLFCGNFETLRTLLVSDVGVSKENSPKLCTFQTASSVYVHSRNLASLNHIIASSENVQTPLVNLQSRRSLFELGGITEFFGSF